MIAYKRGDVILVPFPFSNQATTKRRPAVIISADNYNSISSDVIIMAITSRIEHIFEIGEREIEDWKWTYPITGEPFRFFNYDANFPEPKEWLK